MSKTELFESKQEEFEMLREDEGLFLLAFSNLNHFLIDLLFLALSSEEEEDERKVSLDKDVKILELVFGNKNRLLECLKQPEQESTESEVKRKPVWQDSGKLFSIFLR